YLASFPTRRSSDLIYFYERASNGTWNQVKKFEGEEFFGESVTLEGHLAAAFETNSRGASEREIDAFVRDSSGVWQFDGKVAFPEDSGFTHLASDVEIDAGRLAISTNESFDGRSKIPHITIYERVG